MIDTTDLKNSSKLNMIYMNIASNYSTSRNYDSALHYFRKSIYFSERIKDTVQTLSTKVQFANFYLNFDQFDKAKELLESVNPYKNKTGNEITELYLDMNNGSYHLSNKNPLKAIAYFKNAFQRAEAMNYVDPKKFANYGLYEAYRLLNRSDSALHYYLQFERWKDTLEKAEMRDKILKAGLDAEYTAQKKIDEKENKLQLHKAEQKEKQQRIISISSLIILILVIIFSVIIYRKLILTNKQKLEIQAQKLKIEEKQKEILDSIHYAKRIQNSLLRNEKYVHKSILSQKNQTKT